MVAWRDMDGWIDRAEAYQQHVNLDADGFYPDLTLADLDPDVADELAAAVEFLDAA